MLPCQFIRGLAHFTTNTLSYLQFYSAISRQPTVFRRHQSPAIADMVFNMASAVEINFIYLSGDISSMAALQWMFGGALKTWFKHTIYIFNYYYNWNTVVISHAILELQIEIDSPFMLNYSFELWNSLDIQIFLPTNPPFQYHLYQWGANSSNEQCWHTALAHNSYSYTIQPLRTFSYSKTLYPSTRCSALSQ